jgi:hypothetical protein
MKHKGSDVKVSNQKDYQSVTLAHPTSTFAVVDDNNENKAQETT